MNKSLTNILNEITELEIAIIDNDGEIPLELIDREIIAVIEKKEKVAAYDFKIQKLESSVSVFKAKADEYYKYAKYISNTIDRIHEHLKFTMQQRGLSEISGDDVRYKLVPTNPALNIIPDKIPEYYKHQVTTTEIDKAKIKQDLIDGIVIEGAELKHGVSLRKYKNRG